MDSLPVELRDVIYEYVMKLTVAVGKTRAEFVLIATITTSESVELVYYEFWKPKSMWNSSGYRKEVCEKTQELVSSLECKWGLRATVRTNYWLMPQCELVRATRDEDEIAFEKVQAMVKEMKCSTEMDVSLLGYLVGLDATFLDLILQGELQFTPPVRALMLLTK